MKLTMNSNLISGFIFLLLSLLIWLLIPRQIQILEGVPQLNAQTFPKIVTGIMLVLSIVLIIQGLFFTKQESGAQTTKKEVIRREMNAIIMIVIFLAYAFLFEKIGFIISSIALCITCLAFYKIKNWKYYLITITVVLFVYFIFEQVLQLDLP
ncbi:tripartite tricarboxylate transporter TctB family protein [Alteribacillus sp. YIM 98480]|uniref:tripartite tricarboxylate transporter TctB family protein n=1 Tax=Alteribacillus sp. YIM 98480 TaxID=2606599 RepID=UPI00131B4501|nr:tripartite tricarboxylate transporter TctB family protein [Alteribacillus sp. YIM 98480]